MEWFQALILGIIQGLTEFLPVSSSGHLELAKSILNIEVKEDLTFTVLVHGATVLSTIVVFRKDILALFTNLFTFKWNDDNKYVAKLIISMIPVAILGLFFKNHIESLFTNNVFLVGCMLLITGLLLAFTFYTKEKDKSISFSDAFIIGIAQAIAVIPGISRSGSTIAVALLLKNKKNDATRFSFLMVLIPIIGANVKEIMDGTFSSSNIEIVPLIIGFVAAFIAGLVACTWMIQIVKKQKLIWFAVYCGIVGLSAILFSLNFTIQ